MSTPPIPDDLAAELDRQLQGDNFDLTSFSRLVARAQIASMQATGESDVARGLQMVVRQLVDVVESKRSDGSGGGAGDSDAVFFAGLMNTPRGLPVGEMPQGLLPLPSFDVAESVVPDDAEPEPVEESSYAVQRAMADAMLDAGGDARELSSSCGVSASAGRKLLRGRRKAAAARELRGP